MPYSKCWYSLNQASITKLQSLIVVQPMFCPTVNLPGITVTHSSSKLVQFNLIGANIILLWLEVSATEVGLTRNEPVGLTVVHVLTV